VRCFFVKAARITAIEETPGLTDAEAIEKGRLLFNSRHGEFDGSKFGIAPGCSFRIPRRRNRTSQKSLSSGSSIRGPVPRPRLL
jgi:hypothetical protein